jgi:hypothetical protein
VAVDHQQHERRDQHDPEDRDLIGKREITHRLLSDGAQSIDRRNRIGARDGPLRIEAASFTSGRMPAETAAATAG